MQSSHRPPAHRTAATNLPTDHCKCIQWDAQKQQGWLGGTIEGIAAAPVLLFRFYFVPDGKTKE